MKTKRPKYPIHQFLSILQTLDLEKEHNISDKRAEELASFIIEVCKKPEAQCFLDSPIRSIRKKAMTSSNIPAKASARATSKSTEVIKGTKNVPRDAKQVSVESAGTPVEVAETPVEVEQARAEVEEVPEIAIKKTKKVEIQSPPKVQIPKKTNVVSKIKQPWR